MNNKSSQQSSRNFKPYQDSSELLPSGSFLTKSSQMPFSRNYSSGHTSGIGDRLVYSTNSNTADLRFSTSILKSHINGSQSTIHAPDHSPTKTKTSFIMNMDLEHQVRASQELDSQPHQQVDENHDPHEKYPGSQVRVQKEYNTTVQQLQSRYITEEKHRGRLQAEQDDLISPEAQIMMSAISKGSHSRQGSVVRRNKVSSFQRGPRCDSKINSKVVESSLTRKSKSKKKSFGSMKQASLTNPSSQPPLCANIKLGLHRYKNSDGCQEQQVKESMDSRIPYQTSDQKEPTLTSDEHGSTRDRLDGLLNSLGIQKRTNSGQSLIKQLKLKESASKNRQIDPVNYSTNKPTSLISPKVPSSIVTPSSQHTNFHNQLYHTPSSAKPPTSTDAPNIRSISYLDFGNYRGGMKESNVQKQMYERIERLNSISVKHDGKVRGSIEGMNNLAEMLMKGDMANLEQIIAGVNIVERIDAKMSKRNFFESVKELFRYQKKSNIANMLKASQLIEKLEWIQTFRIPFEEIKCTAIENQRAGEIQAHQKTLLIRCIAIRKTVDKLSMIKHFMQWKFWAVTQPTTNRNLEWELSKSISSRVSARFGNMKGITQDGSQHTSDYFSQSLGGEDDNDLSEYISRVNTDNIDDHREHIDFLNDQMLDEQSIEQSPPAEDILRPLNKDSDTKYRFLSNRQSIILENSQESNYMSDKQTPQPMQEFVQRLQLVVDYNDISSGWDELKKHMRLARKLFKARQFYFKVAKLRKKFVMRHAFIPWVQALIDEASILSDLPQGYSRGKSPLHESDSKLNLKCFESKDNLDQSPNSIIQTHLAMRSMVQQNTNRENETDSLKSHRTEVVRKAEVKPIVKEGETLEETDQSDKFEIFIHDVKSLCTSSKYSKHSQMLDKSGKMTHRSGKSQFSQHTGRSDHVLQKLSQTPMIVKSSTEEETRLQSNCSANNQYQIECHNAQFDSTQHNIEQNHNDLMKRIESLQPKLLEVSSSSDEYCMQIKEVGRQSDSGEVKFISSKEDSVLKYVDSIEIIDKPVLTKSMSKSYSSESSMKQVQCLEYAEPSLDALGNPYMGKVVKRGIVKGRYLDQDWCDTLTSKITLTGLREEEITFNSKPNHIVTGRVFDVSNSENAISLVCESEHDQSRGSGAISKQSEFYLESEMSKFLRERQLYNNNENSQVHSGGSQEQRGMVKQLVPALNLVALQTPVDDTPGQIGKLCQMSPSLNSLSQYSHTLSRDILVQHNTKSGANTKDSGLCYVRQPGTKISTIQGFNSSRSKLGIQTPSEILVRDNKQSEETSQMSSLRSGSKGVTTSSLADHPVMKTQLRNTVAFNKGVDLQNQARTLKQIPPYEQKQTQLQFMQKRALTPDMSTNRTQGKEFSFQGGIKRRNFNVHTKKKSSIIDINNPNPTMFKPIVENHQGTATFKIQSRLGKDHTSPITARISPHPFTSPYIDPNLNQQPCGCQQTVKSCIPFYIDMNQQVRGQLEPVQLSPEQFQDEGNQQKQGIKEYRLEEFLRLDEHKGELMEQSEPMEIAPESEKKQGLYGDNMVTTRRINTPPKQPDKVESEAQTESLPDPEPMQLTSQKSPELSDKPEVVDISTSPPRASKPPIQVTTTQTQTEVVSNKEAPMSPPIQESSPNSCIHSIHASLPPKAKNSTSKLPRSPCLNSYRVPMQHHCGCQPMMQQCSCQRMEIPQCTCDRSECKPTRLKKAKRRYSQEPLQVGCEYQTLTPPKNCGRDKLSTSTSPKFIQKKVDSSQKDCCHYSQHQDCFHKTPLTMSQPCLHPCQIAQSIPTYPQVACHHSQITCSQQHSHRTNEDSIKNMKHGRSKQCNPTCTIPSGSKPKPKRRSIEPSHSRSSSQSKCLSKMMNNKHSTTNLMPNYFVEEHINDDSASYFEDNTPCLGRSKSRERNVLKKSASSNGLANEKAFRMAKLRLQKVKQLEESKKCKGAVDYIKKNIEEAKKMKKKNTKLTPIMSQRLIF